MIFPVSFAVLEKLRIFGGKGWTKKRNGNIVFEMMLHIKNNITKYILNRNRFGLEYWQIVISM